MNARARSLVALFGALIYALFGLRILASSAASLVVDTRDYIVTSSEGLGAVSIGLSAIILPDLLLLVVAFFVHPGPFGQLLLPLSGVAWGMLFLLTAALLGAYGVRASRA